MTHERSKVHQLDPRYKGAYINQYTYCSKLAKSLAVVGEAYAGDDLCRICLKAKRYEAKG